MAFKSFNKNLVGLAHRVRFYLYGSFIESREGNIDPGNRSTDPLQDRLEIYRPNGTDTTTLLAEDIYGTESSFGLLHIKHEITSTTIPTPNNQELAIVTSNNGSFLTNEIWRYYTDGTNSTWLKVPQDNYKDIIIVGSGFANDLTQNGIFTWDGTNWIPKVDHLRLGDAPDIDGIYGGNRGNVSGMVKGDNLPTALNKIETLLGQLAYSIRKRRKSPILDYTSTGTITVDTVPAGYHIKSITVIILETFDSTAGSLTIKTDRNGTITTEEVITNSDLVANNVYEIPIEVEVTVDTVITVDATFTGATQGQYQVLIAYRGTD